MPEALTESFCERCGTRYEFAAPTRLTTVRKTRGLISGLKNYIMSQDALGDAVGDAMRSEEAAVAAQQLEAFHESFSFCINCRQYTCVNCWNDDAGRCRTCVPIPGTDDLRERFEASFTASHPDLAPPPAELASDELQRRLGVDAWPESDLPQTEAAAEAAAESTQPLLAGPEPAEAEPAVEPEPITALEPVQPEVAAPAWEEDAGFELLPEPMPEVTAEVASEAPAEPLVEERPIPEPAHAADTLPAALEVEAQPAAPEPMPEVAAEAPMPEAPMPEPPATQPTVPEAPRPTPAPIRPVSETIVQMPSPATPPPVPNAPAPSDEERIPAAAAAGDPALTARQAQLDLLGLGDPGEGPVAPARQNVLPYRSRGTAPSAAEIAALQERVAGQATSGFWEASAREVADATGHVGVQSCGECGLSLSASARFCRRCGTRQAQSA